MCEKVLKQIPRTKQRQNKKRKKANAAKKKLEKALGDSLNLIMNEKLDWPMGYPLLIIIIKIKIDLAMAKHKTIYTITDSIGKKMTLCLPPYYCPIRVVCYTTHVIF